MKFTSQPLAFFEASAASEFRILDFLDGKEASPFQGSLELEWRAIVIVPTWKQ